MSALLVALSAGALLLTACGNSESSGSSGADDTSGDDGASADSGEKVAVDAPGVTDDVIRVGGVASVTNPLNGKYDTAFEGVDAYFEMVNSEGGVHGRQLELVAERDDKVANNSAEVTGLLEQDDVFAVLPVATLLFTGADQLVAAGVPTFGWSINPEWEGTPEEPRENLFGQAGSFLCLGCDQPTIPYLAQQAGRSRIGVLAYAVPQSARCAEGWAKSFDTYGEEAGAEVAFTDSSLSYGTTDFSVQVSKMKDAGVDMIVTCMDTNGVVNLAKELKKQDVDAIQYLPNGYDQELLDEFGDLFEGSFVYTSFAPLEITEVDGIEQPQGQADYLEWIEKTGGEVTENSIAGWLNAALLVEGLREAGPDFDRQKVIDAINRMTDWDADGFLSGTNWTTAHTERSDPNCAATLRIEDGTFVPMTGPDGEIFTCFDLAGGTLEPSFK